MDNEILEMPALEFGPKKTDPLSLVQNFLEQKHGKDKGLEILKLMCAGDVIQLAEEIKTDRIVTSKINPGGADTEPLVMPELTFD